jgi:predicted signal transduction protein with EAL and GGDEF domain
LASHDQTLPPSIRRWVIGTATLGFPLAVWALRGIVVDGFESPLAVFPHHGTDARDVLRAADAALFSAKGAGRGCWRLSPAPLAATN